MKLGLSILLAAGLFVFCGLATGDPAPDFSAKNQDGKVIKLSDYQGKPVLLYFYPKDETPGCTKEACSFRDDFKKFKKAGAVVLGVSAQDEKSHKAFSQNHKLPFDLLADTDGTLAKLYGVQTIPMTTLYKRESVLIGPNGKVVRYYHEVNPDNHTRQVLEDLAQIKKS